MTYYSMVWLVISIFLLMFTPKVANIINDDITLAFYFVIIIISFIIYAKNAIVNAVKNKNDFLDKNTKHKD